MALRAKIMLKHNLSGETLDAVRRYLKQFLDQKYSLEHFDGQLSIYLHNADDVGQLRQQFPSLIKDVQRLH